MSIKLTSDCRVSYDAKTMKVYRTLVVSFRQYVLVATWNGIKYYNLGTK